MTNWSIHELHLTNLVVSVELDYERGSYLDIGSDSLNHNVTSEFVVSFFLGRNLTRRKSAKLLTLSLVVHN